jgi:transporter family-2 protein
MRLALLLLALLAGVALTVQVGLNAQLRTWTISPVVATLASFLVGSATLLLYTLATRAPLPAAGRMAAAPWWVWAGGVLGAGYVLATIVLAPRLGPGVLFGAVVAGQMAAAVVVEHYGWLGFQAHPVNAARLAGVALIVGGVVLLRRF